MNKINKILTAILGFIMLVPGLAKLKEPFKTFIYQHLEIIRFPFPEMMQYVVKFSEISIGVLLLFLAFKSSSIPHKLRDKTFYAAHFVVILMMLVAIYTHLHPGVPAQILPFEYKPPVMGISYIILAAINMNVYRKNMLQN